MDHLYFEGHGFGNEHCIENERGCSACSHVSSPGCRIMFEYLWRDDVTFLAAPGSVSACRGNCIVRITPKALIGIFFDFQKQRDEGKQFSGKEREFLVAYRQAFPEGKYIAKVEEWLNVSENKKDAALKLPSITKWRDLRISYVDEETLFFSNDNVKYRLTAGDIGWTLRSKKEGGFRKEWKYLMSLVLGKPIRTNKTIRCNVNRWFKRQFDIKENPIYGNNEYLFKVKAAPGKLIHAGQYSSSKYDGEDNRQTTEEDITEIARAHTDPQEYNPEDDWDKRIDSGKPVNEE